VAAAGCHTGRDHAALAGVAHAVKAYGYRCWRHASPLFSALNFNRRDADIFSGRSALALLAIPEEIEADVAPDACIELS